MRRFAVFGSGYNPNIPTCFVSAYTLEEAWETARKVLAPKCFVEAVVEYYEGP